MHCCTPLWEYGYSIFLFCLFFLGGKASLTGGPPSSAFWVLRLQIKPVPYCSWPPHPLFRVILKRNKVILKHKHHFILCKETSHNSLPGTAYPWRHHRSCPADEGSRRWHHGDTEWSCQWSGAGRRHGGRHRGGHEQGGHDSQSPLHSLSPLLLSYSVSLLLSSQVLFSEELSGS